VIALIGARAAGKTTVGRSLASRLGRPFLDLDEEIERAAGASVAELLRRSEPNFRELEARRLLEIASAAPADLILALGGGAPLREESQRCLRRFVVIHLGAGAAALRARLSGEGDRRPPLLGADAAEEIERVLEIRNPTYRKLADWSLETDALDAEAAAAAAAAYVARLASLERSRFAAPAS
jgi:shikimate kinase